MLSHISSNSFGVAFILYPQSKNITIKFNSMRTLQLLIIGMLLCLGTVHVSAQGCVAIRSMSCSGNISSGSTSTGQVGGGDILVSAGYRYFKSFRHFRGAEEEPERVEQGTEVINHFNGIDLGISYGITNRLSATLVLPININHRSSMYEHYGNSTTANPDRKRFSTESAGLSDIRLSASYWLLNPEKMRSGNIALGLGIKAPTGKKDVIDTFHKLDQEGADYTTERPVDQSIQLGDGGWGFSVETQGFQRIYKHLSAFFSGFYMSNPMNHNGVLRSPTNNPTVFSYFSGVDQYSARVGLFYSATNQLAFSLGSRLEGIPATDLIGKSEGFRRPGYVVSVEPGVNVQHKRFAFNLNVPIALERNRIKSTSDKLNGSHGDAAFADYVVNVSVAYLFSTKNKGSNIEVINQ